MASKHGFKIKGGLAGGTDEEPKPAGDLNTEQKAVIKKYMSDLHNNTDYTTVEKVKEVTKLRPPATEEGKKELRDVGLMESYSYLHSNNLMSDKQFYSRNLRMNKGLIRESIITRK
jgi:hypothetical protein